MKKVVTQGIIIVLFFLSILFVMNKIDWMNFFQIKKVTDSTEEKLGELFIEFFKDSDPEIYNPYIVNTIDSLVTKICEENSINRTKIKLHVLQNEQINAFALPDAHLVIYSGLILESKNQEELCGVIAHELAHIQLNHVMKKLAKEIGLSVLLSMATGNGGGEIIKEASKLLSSSAFDRSMEKEADIKAVDYLSSCNLSSKPFADFLYNLSINENSSNKYLTWISTHPDSKDRANYILNYSKNKIVDSQLIISENSFEKLKEKLE